MAFEQGLSEQIFKLFHLQADRRRPFLLYLSLALLGSAATGWIYNAV